MKQIEDFIHLYLGCEVKTDTGKVVLHGENLNKAINLKWKPILRLISDITEEEAIELVENITYNHVRFSSKESALSCFDKDNYNKKVKHMLFYADELKYLLSKHFDLFGLIEAGLGIDKKTLK